MIYYNYEFIILFHIILLVVTKDQVWFSVVTVCQPTFVKIFYLPIGITTSNLFSN